MDFSYEAAVEYGRIRAELERAGTTIASLDLWIAAQSVSLDLVQATKNVRESSGFPRLAVENWMRR